MDARARVEIDLSGPELSQGKLDVRIMDKGQIVAEMIKPVSSIHKYVLYMDVTNPKKWNAETPYLYDLVLTLKDGTKTVDIRGGKVGFREVGIRKDGALLINGQRMVFHGVNRHDHSEINGRTVSREEMENDIRLMKRLNINAVRTSHYPNNPYFMSCAINMEFMYWRRPMWSAMVIWVFPMWNSLRNRWSNVPRTM